ncbi:hypothetical protein J0S82_016661 [Galemys pyrenaicus]|uniref:Uncharacterized protein n=1 Tax=Galemys pyrenaicus TaxID=202257 RepID=A0A8J6ALZ3_GALPY|nr:hypothetical protein J0S82_016661 [Galemys pyrenaicus]
MARLPGACCSFPQHIPCGHSTFSLPAPAQAASIVSGATVLPLGVLWLPPLRPRYAPCLADHPPPLVFLQYTSSMRAKYLATSQPRPDSSSSGH